MKARQLYQFVNRYSIIELTMTVLKRSVFPAVRRLLKVVENLLYCMVKVILPAGEFY